MTARILNAPRQEQRRGTKRDRTVQGHDQAEATVVVPEESRLRGAFMVIDCRGGFTF